MSQCPFADRDASYVLGALSPSERLEFEQHLAGCRDCTRAVRELAGLPGLLSKVDIAVLEQPPVEEPLPGTLLPALLRDVRRSGRRRTFVTAGLAAAAAVVVVGVPLAASGAFDSGSTPPAAVAPAGLTMTPVGHAPVQATVALEPVTWGTRLDLTCTYAPGPERYDLPRRVTYVLFVQRRDGSSEQVGTWRSLEGKTMRLTAATAARRADISSVEVRTDDGRPVLRLAG
jgi:hypothetical protein